MRPTENLAVESLFIFSKSRVTQKVVAKQNYFYSKKMLLTQFLLVISIFSVINAKLIVKDKHYWYKENVNLINKRLDYFKLQPESLVKVKNVIVFIADGSGVNSFSAARSYKRQKTGNMDATLIWEEFAASAIVRVNRII